MQNKKSRKRQDILNRLSTLNERLYHAMLLKEQFLTVYKAKDQKTARMYLKEWIFAALKSKIPVFRRIGKQVFPEAPLHPQLFRLQYYHSYFRRHKQ